MNEITSVYEYTTNDPKLLSFHDTRDNPKQAKCIRDNPYGEYIHFHTFKVGDIVTVKGLTGTATGKWLVAIPEVCGFYDATAFELIEN